MKSLLVRGVCLLRPGSPEGKFRDLKMDYEARSRWIHRVNDKRFSSIFTKKGKSTNDKYRHALHTLGLSGKVQFTSVEDNLEKLRKSDTALRQHRAPLSKLLSGPYQGSVLVDVPPQGDCWLLTILAPLLGYTVIEEADQRNIIPTVRRRMSEIVLTVPNQFLHLFGGNQQELEDWTKKIKKWSPKFSREKWGGTTEFEIFAQITGICVHVINKENQSFEPTVQHLVPRTFPRKSWMDEDWTVSVVVVYGYEHYQVLVPETLPNEVTITEGTTDSTGLEALIEISDVDEEDFTETVVQTQGAIRKFFRPTIKRQPQKKLKEEKKAKVHYVSHNARARAREW